MIFMFFPYRAKRADGASSTPTPLSSTAIYSSSEISNNFFLWKKKLNLKIFDGQQNKFWIIVFLINMFLKNFWGE